MLVNMQLRCKNSSMAAQDVEQVRRELDRLLKRKGHGAIGDFAEKAAVHRTIVERFRSGRSAAIRSPRSIPRNAPT